MKAKFFLALLAISFATGCSSMGVKPWERDLLAKDSMKLGGNDIQAGYEKKIYFSRESSSGGSGFAGGGCGCN